MKNENTTALAARASIWFAVCSVIQKCIGLIVIPVYTRLLTEEDYGFYVVFQSWTKITSILLTLNLDSYVFLNGMMKFGDDQDGFSSSMLGLSTCVSLIWSFSFLALTIFWSGILGLLALFALFLVPRCSISPSFVDWNFTTSANVEGMIVVKLADTALGGAAPKCIKTY